MCSRAAPLANQMTHLFAYVALKAYGQLPDIVGPERKRKLAISRKRRWTGRKVRMCRSLIKLVDGPCYDL
jgi:hypothetical protein